MGTTSIRKQFAKKLINQFLLNLFKFKLLNLWGLCSLDCPHSSSPCCRRRSPCRPHWLLAKMPELGKRQYCRDNGTLFSGLEVESYCIMPICVVATPVICRDLKIFIVFSCPWRLSCCRCREAKQLSRAQLYKIEQIYLKKNYHSTLIMQLIHWYNHVRSKLPIITKLLLLPIYLLFWCS